MQYVRPGPPLTPGNSSALSDIASTLYQALALHSRGELRRAEFLCHQVLQRQPNNAGALNMLGVLATQTGHPERTIPFIARSLAIDPAQPAAYSNLGNALMMLGRHGEAAHCFDQALALRPHYSIALLNRGIACIHLERYESAVESLPRALHEAPDNPAARMNRALALTRLGRLEEAIADYDRAIALGLEDTTLVLRRADLLVTSGRAAEAVADLDRLLRSKPDHAEAHNSRGLTLLQLGHFEQALAGFDRALEIEPAMADAHNNRGLVLRHLKRFDGALESLERALALRPDFPQALNNRGWVLLCLGRHPEAIASLQQALAIRPDFVEALTNLAAALRRCERVAEALGCIDQALGIDPGFPDALGIRGMLLMQAGRSEEAIDCFRRLIGVAPDRDYAPGDLLEAQLRTCEWSGRSEGVAPILQAITEGRPVIRPFSLLALTDDPARQLACARSYAQQQYPSYPGSTVTPVNPRRSERLHLAYVSGDLGEHAVSYLMAGVFEQHDRRGFEVSAICLRPTRSTNFSQRLRDSFDQFLDLSSLSDEEVVARMRQLQVDIAIDLSGYTGVGRTAIFARRAAPIQVNYLGFPGTMGASFMDYIIADDFVIPAQSCQYYAEQVVHLPQCFQANDSRRHSADTLPSRGDCGLPERGLVFCCFNGSVKLNPEFFAVWMRLLSTAPGSVLWLAADNESMVENLRRHALAAHVDPNRLVIAWPLPYPEHLARLGLADLFLDCLPFNAGTTASDALWAGVPVLTCAGRAFAARMAGSLLRAVGLSELITGSVEDYEALALRLAADPSFLSQCRARLAANRASSPLFDTARFCRDLESAYVSMWQRHRRGEPPVGFRVGA